MKINPAISLVQYNTFGLSVAHKGLIHIHNEDHIYEVLTEGLAPIKILGGGSNILLTGDLDCYLLHNQIKGINIVDEDEHSTLVEVGAGEPWHQLVLWSLSHDLGGIENLSLIPGSVGAAPMQNIGAYGVEQEACFHSLRAIHLETGVRTVFYKDDCQFGYRESIFKHESKDQYFITHVCYLLHKKPHVLHLDYGAIRAVLEAKAIPYPTIQDVSTAVIDIRTSKLPDPKVVGNAGSFFKNPVISLDHFEKLKSTYQGIPSYPVSTTEVKVPAGWLIESAGYKGMKRGHAGVHKDQALVLVNHGGATGKEIYALAMDIKCQVVTQFGIDISPEVNVW
ncbi:MAG: UDP-N-acetylmuramate dehydrogenase [Saprospiraceae bacterium]